MTDSFPCCGRKAYADPLFFDENNVRFGTWARCPGCSKLLGSARIAWAAPKGLAAAWKPLSESMTREWDGKDGRPLRYELRAGTLTPVGYKGAAKVQPDMVGEDF